MNASDPQAAPKPLKDFLPEPPRSSRTVREPARDIPVIAETDVAVLGGGPAGVCAAVAAARAGARVVIVERNAYFGGVACAADVNIFHQFWSPDFETKIIGGLPEEALRRLEQMKAVRNSRPDGRGYFAVCTESLKLALDDMVLGSGAKIILHGWLAHAAREGRRIDAALVETKSGRGAVLARVFVDCTGDADLCARAEAPTVTGDAEGLCQPPSLCFRIGGVDFKKAQAAGVTEKVIQAELFKGTMDYNQGKYPTFLWGAVSVWRPDEIMLAGTRVVGVNCARGDDFTRAEIEARFQMRWVLDKLRHFAGYENLHLVDIGAEIGVRETRRIAGEHQVQEQELLEGVRFPDTIAQGSYPVDLHNPHGPGIRFRYLDGTERAVAGDGAQTTGRWDGQRADAPKRRTPCYCVPFRALVPKALDNVLVAGRCLSASHEAAGALRVMINAMSFGHAAGRAAATAAARHEGQVRRVNVVELRQQLKNDGVPLLDLA